MKTRGDTRAIRRTILQAAITAHPQPVIRDDLPLQEFDDRTVAGQIKQLANAGCIRIVDRQRGRVRELAACSPVVEAARALA